MKSGLLNRNRMAAIAACVVLVATVGIVNHSRAHRGQASASPGPVPSAGSPTASALSCARRLEGMTAQLLSVADVWPGSGGGGYSTAGFDLTGCAARPPITSPPAPCQLDAIGDLSSAGALYLAGLGARTVHSRQLVHAPLAAVTEIVVTFASPTAAGGHDLTQMVTACTPSLPPGLKVAAAASSASRNVVIVEFDDESLTPALGDKIIARAQVLAGD